MRYNTLIFPIIACALLASCGQADRTVAISKVDTIPVTLQSLEQGVADAGFEATGVFTTEDETMLSFKNGGVISQILVQEGDPIRKGQRLASVQQTELNAQVGQAQIALEKARRDYERASKLYRDSVATLEQMQNAKSAFDAAQKDIESASYNQGHLHIVSPVNGFVLAKLANAGQVVGPGTPVLQVNGAGKGDWKLKVGVSDYQWSHVKVGDPATIETDALPDTKLKAKVTQKSEGLDPQSGTFSIYLEFLEKPSGKLASGIFGKSTIRPSGNTKAEKGWTIPYESLIDANGKEAYVFITNDGKTAVKQKVTLGKMTNESVTVTQGLEGIQHLVVSGSAYLMHGSPIKIVQQK